MRGKVMAAKSVNGFSVNASKKLMKRSTHQPLKTIDWYCKMTRDGNLSQDRIAKILIELENFIDQKYCEKAEITAELQLAEAYQTIFEENLLDINESVDITERVAISPSY